MPFYGRTAQFKRRPRLLACAPRTCTTSPPDGRQVLDGTVRPLVRERRPLPRRASSRRSRRRPPSSTTRRHLPDGPSAGVRVGQPPRQHRCRAASTTSSSPTRGSESVDTALKIAHRLPTRAAASGTKVRLIGRERGYHGVNFGGTAVGGIVEQPQAVRRARRRRRSPAPHARPRPQRLLRRRARAWRRAGRRSRASRRAARRLHHRRRHRRACRRLHRRAHAAEGLSEAPRRDLRPSTTFC